MKKISARVALFTAALLAVGGSVAVFTASPASAHGAMMKPGARSYFCWKDAITTTGAASPTNSACAAAIAKGGVNMLYNWFAVLRSNAGGKMGADYIPDGSICSGGSPASDSPYDMSGLNVLSADWPVTHLTSGASFDWWYSNWAAHPGTWKLYVTKNAYDPTTPLKWSDLEADPFLTVTNPPADGSVGSDTGHYYWTGNLPSGKSGRHLIYSQWIRSDSTENFFGCSDVVFDGGNGEVTGIRDTPATGGSTTTTTRPVTTTTTTTRAGGGTTTTTTRNGGGTTTTTSRSTTTTTTSQNSGGSSSCQVTYTPQQWTGGFTADVKVTSAVALSGWTVKWTYPGDTKVTNAWNSTVSQSGNAVTATNAAWNGTVPAGGSTSFGFQGTWSSNNASPTDFSVNGVACNGTGGGGGSTTTTTTTRPTTTTTGGGTVTTTTRGTTTTTTRGTTTTTTTTGGGGNASALNEGFEAQTAGAEVAGGWTTHPQKTCDSGADGSGQATGTATIDGTLAHSGSKSLKVVGLAQFCQHLLAKAPVNLASVGSNVYVRTWFRHATAFTGQHVSFMAMTDTGDNADIRIGIQQGGGSKPVLMWNREKSDATVPAMSPNGVNLSVEIPTNTWTCMEYAVTPTGAQTWINGTQVAGLTIDGTPTADIDSGWGAWTPKVSDLRLGWESYGSTGDTFWYDDVAVSNSRIGC